MSTMAGSKQEDELAEARRIAARMLAMPPTSHGDSKPKKAKPGAAPKRKSEADKQSNRP
jgi:hypothetical protein